LDAISKYLPEHPYLYDPEFLTTENIRDIYKEFIRETIFEEMSDEVPYESDVIIEKLEELERLDRVFATIIVERQSQKNMIIGQKGAAIKRIGTKARQKIEQFSGKKIYLALHVVVKKGWSKNRKQLEEIGYIF
jgi:GTP-binding protein Era